MKPTTKVNIGGYAFTLEEDAYQRLDCYLDSLKKHFEKNPEQKEIIEDIEQRISELLHLRLEKEQKVVSDANIREIIDIMGNPRDFGDEEQEQTDQSDYSKTNNSIRETISAQIKKKLFRDPGQTIIAGVFGGLSHYLKIDAVLLRVIYVVLFLISMSISGRLGVIFIVFYIILWIVMPKANTFYRKLAMTGTNPSIENIEARDNTPVQYKGRGIRTFFRVIGAIICGIIALTCLVIIIATIFGAIWLNTDSQAFTLNEYLGLVGLNTWDFKISSMLLLLLPIIGILYFALKGMICSRLNIGDLIISIVAILVYIGALFYMAVPGYRFARALQSSARVTEVVPVQSTSDTIYLKLNEKYLTGKPAIYSPQTFVLEENDQKSLFILPHIIINQDSIINSTRIEIGKSAYAESYFLAKQKAERLHLDHTIQDSCMIVSPVLYNKNNQFDFSNFYIYINAPISKTIIVEEPLSY